MPGKYGDIEVTFIGRDDLVCNTRSTKRAKDKADIEELTGRQTISDAPSHAPEKECESMPRTRLLYLILLTLLSITAPHARCQAPNAWENRQPLKRGARNLPETGDHPGNVFRHGQAVRIARPGKAARATRWQVIDETGRERHDFRKTVQGYG